MFLTELVLSSLLGPQSSGFACSLSTQEEYDLLYQIIKNLTIERWTGAGPCMIIIYSIQSDSELLCFSLYPFC